MTDSHRRTFFREQSEPRVGNQGCRGQGGAGAGPFVREADQLDAGGYALGKTRGECLVTARENKKKKNQSARETRGGVDLTITRPARTAANAGPKLRGDEFGCFQGSGTALFHARSKGLELARPHAG